MAGKLREFNDWLREKNRHPIHAAKAHMIGYLEEYLAVKHGMGLGLPSDIYTRMYKGEKFIKIRYEQLVEAVIQEDERKRRKECSSI